MFLTDRRRLINGLALFAGLGPAFGAAVTAPAAIRLGAAAPFSFASLRARAKKNATQPYKAPVAHPAQRLQAINYDAVQKIRFRPDHSLWRSAALPYPASFFHLNKYSGDPVILHAVDGTVARPILYGADYFDYSAAGLDPGTMNDLGFAGFRINDSQTNQADWLAFQGASYFRSAGQDDQYGASARGIAINTAATAEEFPRFSEFWLDEHGPVVTIYALLDGPSVTGAYKFDAMKNAGGAVIMNVHCDLFFRAAITRLGIAPLTSMFWYGENQRDQAADWRPEIHDNDGLALWTGAGERIWRPLVNPPQVQTNSFSDNSPRGFGLMQRDRDFDDYQDDSVFYNRRPGVWVEPLGKWGPGAVQLVEIPTDDEVHDNIVAYWRPDGEVSTGDTLAFDYRLYWQDSEPAFPKSTARTVATRIGRGGFPGQVPWPRDRQKIVIDFDGGALAQLSPVHSDIAPIISASSGRIDSPFVVKVAGTTRWRTGFDIVPSGKAPIDLRCYLKAGGKAMTETWLYQYFPPG